jgi:hypothetical protein
LNYNDLKNKKSKYILSIHEDGRIMSSFGIVTKGTPIVAAGKKVIAPSGEEYDAGDMILGLQGKDWYKALEYMQSPKGQERGWKILDSDEVLPGRPKSTVMPSLRKDKFSLPDYVDNLEKTARAKLVNKQGKMASPLKVGLYYTYVSDMVHSSQLDNDSKGKLQNEVRDLFAQFLVESASYNVARTIFNTQQKESEKDIARKRKKESKEKVVEIVNEMLEESVPVAPRFLERTAKLAKVFLKFYRAEEDVSSRTPAPLAALVDHVLSLNPDMDRTMLEGELLKIKPKKHTLFVKKRGKLQINSDYRGNIFSSKHEIVDVLMKQIYGESSYEEIKRRVSDNPVFNQFDVALAYFPRNIDEKTGQPVKDSAHRWKVNAILRDIKKGIYVQRIIKGVTGEVDYKIGSEKFTIESALAIEDDTKRKLVLDTILKKLKSEVKNIPEGTPGRDGVRKKIYEMLDSHVKNTNYERIPPESFLTPEVLSDYESKLDGIDAYVNALAIYSDAFNLQYATFERRESFFDFKNSFSDLFTDELEGIKLGLDCVFSLGYDDVSKDFDGDIVEVIKGHMTQSERDELSQLTGRDYQLQIARFFYDNKSRISTSSAVMSKAKLRMVDPDLAKSLKLSETDGFTSKIHESIRAFASSLDNFGVNVVGFAQGLMSAGSDENSRKSLADTFVNYAAGKSNPNKDTLSRYLLETTRVASGNDKDIGNFTEAAMNVSILMSLVGRKGSVELNKLSAHVSELSGYTKDGRKIGVVTSGRSFGYADSAVVFYDKEGRIEQVVPIEQKAHKSEHFDVAHVTEVKAFAEILRALKGSSPQSETIPVTSALQTTLRNNGKNFETFNVDRGMQFVNAEASTGDTGVVTNPEMIQRMIVT